MPKDEFDPEDPLEIVGTHAQGNLDEMGLAIVDEFILMGFGEKELLDIFNNPFYQLPYGVLESKGEAHVRAIIKEGLKRWASTAANITSAKGPTIPDF